MEEPSPTSWPPCWARSTAGRWASTPRRRCWPPPPPCWPTPCSAPVGPVACWRPWAPPWSGSGPTLPRGTRCVRSVFAAPRCAAAWSWCCAPCGHSSTVPARGRTSSWGWLRARDGGPRPRSCISSSRPSSFWWPVGTASSLRRRSTTAAGPLHGTSPRSALSRRASSSAPSPGSTPTADRALPRCTSANLRRPGSVMEPGSPSSSTTCCLPSWDCARAGRGMGGREHVGHALFFVVLVALVVMLLRVAWAARLGRVAAPLLAAGVAVVAFPFLYAIFPTSWYWADGRYGVYLPPLLVLLAVWSLPAVIAAPSTAGGPRPTPTSVRRCGRRSPWAGRVGLGARHLLDGGGGPRVRRRPDPPPGLLLRIGRIRTRPPAR